MLRMQLKSPAAVQIYSLITGPVAYGSPPQQEPGVWFTVDVPGDAAFLAFDFEVTGASAEDRVDCAVGGQNIFSLPARFVEGEPMSSTDMIDISCYAGQSVEFFFGLTGGTSHGCELTVEGMRFIAQPAPRMQVEPMAGGVRVAWPATATGWRAEASSTLAPADWQLLPQEEGKLEGGRAVMERTADGPAMFYRLRRDP